MSSAPQGAFPASASCIFGLFSHNDLVSSRTIGNHRDRHSDLLLDGLDIFLTVLRKILVVLDSADLALPARKSLVYRFCFLKLRSCREVFCYLSIDLIAYADMKLVKISSNVENREGNLCGSLDLYAIS